MTCKAQIRISHHSKSPMNAKPVAKPAMDLLVIMQNKPNFRDAQVNVSATKIKDYENKSHSTLGENKPNSNPKQTQ